ncbi:unnamed protein product [Nezara viridula]|uniref:Uncharacterized protein n=1 Tax=Nezara viridula TaxID=85310 RepID=A0A9P0MY16_NEZVI|nr:unnamed protein product [Nezara viridula]
METESLEWRSQVPFTSCDRLRVKCRGSTQSPSPSSKDSPQEHRRSIMSHPLEDGHPNEEEGEAWEREARHAPDHCSQDERMKHNETEGV